MYNLIDFVIKLKSISISVNNSFSPKLSPDVKVLMQAPSSSTHWSSPFFTKYKTVHFSCVLSIHSSFLKFLIFNDCINNDLSGSSKCDKTRVVLISSINKF